ncbi:GlsB/YeaQ/YmgE family stress response membrane protein [Paenibacillus sp. ISL-20]|uniref:GlsB/YeaQ/YmgE family stress response membrane protein n=1 Tax=Paenibacillus sp. ISL-20 TaxID=2819163 RepID=UPI001BEBBC1C|nr:GlsB/YeaQ/YmgE family stress response membrane protein [Paenibacillus sp. ISL-20]MBT2764963.1 GlsB/YeaQ/YmgE family stress response membrane protein [Paenibacillus sp. ISL-20]
MDLQWVLIFGGLIVWLSGNLIGRDVPSGVLGNIIAGFIGSWLGTGLLGPRGPVIGGFHIIPAIVGSIIALLIFFALARGGSFRRRLTKRGGNRYRRS